MHLAASIVWPKPKRGMVVPNPIQDVVTRGLVRVARPVSDAEQRRKPVEGARLEPVEGLADNTRNFIAI